MTCFKLVVLTALLASGCSSGVVGVPSPGSSTLAPISTTTSSAAPQAGVTPPSRNLNPKDFGFTQRADGAWASRDGIVVELKSGEVLKISSADGSLACWDMWIFTGKEERPDIGHASFLYRTAQRDVLPGKTDEKLSIEHKDGVKIGRISCKRS